MKNRLPLNESWQLFLADLIIKFVELNKEQFGEQKSYILIKFSKGQSIEKIASDKNLSATRIRQLMNAAAQKLDRIISAANVEELNSLKEVCKGLEIENNSLRRTLTIHGHGNSTPLTKLDLSVRARKILESLNITSVEQLCTTQVEEIMKTRNAGLKTITEIEKSLDKLGLHLNCD